MINTKDPNKILYIEPDGKPTEPIIDELTRKMTAALRQSKRGPGYRGWHDCTGEDCEASSSNCEHILPNGKETNYLAVHYLACHRTEVPESELEKVRALDFGEEEPNDQELGFYND